LWIDRVLSVKKYGEEKIGFWCKPDNYG